MAIGELYKELQIRSSLCGKLKPLFLSREWRYVAGNYEFLKDGMAAHIYKECIVFSFQSCDGRSIYAYTIHKIYFNKKQQYSLFRQS